jgi:hypothetical protein
MRIKVAVTGASGRTGRLVVQRLLLEPERYEPVAIVRSRRAAEDIEALFARAAAAAEARGAPQEGERAASAGASASASAATTTTPTFGAVHIVDFCEGLTSETREEDDTGDSPTEQKLYRAFTGCRAVVVASSAVAEPKVWSSLAVAAQVGATRLMARLMGRAAPKGAAFVPVATWKGGQAPREVDWLGAKRIFRAFLKAAGGGGSGQQGAGGHVVLISSAGGCDPRHFLNRIARGEVLNWKRRAEQELIRMCGGRGGGGGGGAGGGASTAASPAATAKKTTTYTILHPNHLIDNPKPPKPGALPTSPTEFFDPRRSRVLLAVDDELQKPHWSRRPRVPRGALAELAVQCVALARPAGGDDGGWCEWEEERAGVEAVGSSPAPARDRSVDVGVEAVAKGGEGAAAEAQAAASSPARMTQLFASLLRAMPRDCDYGINDRTAEEEGQQWACAET